MLIVSPFVIVVMNVQMAQRQYQLQHLRSSLAAEQREHETLREQVLRESSPEGIAWAAQARGLVPAPGITVVSVPPSDAPPPNDDSAVLAASDDVPRNKLADAP